MSDLHMSFFGGGQITGQDGAIELQLPPTSLSLFAFLVLNRQRSYRRSVLLGLFWGEYDEERARGCLNTTLWRLRSTLETTHRGHGTFLIATPTADGEIRFNPKSDYWLDVAFFEDQVRRGNPHRPITEMDQASAEALEAAVQTYHGDLLEGLYDDWVLRERERLRAVYLDSLARLMVYYRCQQIYDKSILYGQLILAFDPLREEIHREVMRTYLESGRRAAAIQQYENCCQILARELGISPMPETQALFAQITSPDSPPLPIFSEQLPSEQPVTLAQALQQLNLAMGQLEEAQKQLQQSIQSVRQIIEH
jgi:DNA-binding SARP family transcriptional activator